VQKILIAYGTRPEAIKMAPVVGALKKRQGLFEVVVCATAQHRQMMDQVHQVFGLEADIDLDLMRSDQTLNDLSSRCLVAIDDVLADHAPDWVLVQGDTTTAMVVALAAFHRGIRVGHVEAGLRTGDLRHPFPEEANRRIIDVFADALFAPTSGSANALLAEGVASERVFVTGNTGIDALLQAADRDTDREVEDEVLITVHRRESFGGPIREIFRAIRELSERFPDTRWVYPVHRNPNVRRAADEVLQGRPNLELHEPFDYLELVQHLRSARLILTDSGGIQEEAPTFSKPVLVLRKTTERPEGVEAGVSRLVGADRELIVAETVRLLTDEDEYRRMTAAANPYGDGKAAERIAQILANEPWEPFSGDQK
jgi:UDP-N-acetylglucosamine 2-epimerase (non-hydrolysing)